MVTSQVTRLYPHDRSNDEPAVPFESRAPIGDLDQAWEVGGTARPTRRARHGHGERSVSADCRGRGDRREWNFADRTRPRREVTDTCHPEWSSRSRGGQGGPV